MKGEILNLSVGGIPEGGETYAPKKNENGKIIIDTKKCVTIPPGEDLPELPEGYDAWVHVPPELT